MKSVFHIDADLGGKTETAGANWSRLGLIKNPFPESGVLGNIVYIAHMPDVSNKVQLWLNGIATKHVGEPRAPFALEGTIGAGKTHLLVAMEKAFQEMASEATEVSSDFIVVRENLVNAGGGRLLLSTLFGANLRLGEIADAVLLADDRSDAITRLPSASPIREALSGDVEAQTLALWLRGSPLTRSQLQAVGGRPLDGEGERLRAVIHLLRVAAELKQVRLVVFLLDQLEDLERRAEITPLRRARFLTDLRIFIDEGLEGAPIALCMAWNTEGTAFMNSLQSQYPALASRLGNRATVPGLPQTHMLPFAQAYLDDAYAKSTVPQGNRRLVLEPKVAASLAGSLKPLPGGDVAPREWLDELRKWAAREVSKV